MKKSLLVHPSELSKKWIDRLADNGFTTLGIHPEGGADAAITLGKLVDKFQDPSFTSLIDYAVERGLEIEYEFHSLSYLLPRSLFSSHPEYFRQNENGERTSDLNMCFSSDEALEIVGQNAAILSKKLYKSSNRYFFWIDDASGGKCNCDKCKSLSVSDQQMIVINAMQRTVRKENNEAMMAYLGYIDVLDAPKVVKPEDGIFLEYAPIYKWKRSPEELEKNKELIIKEKEASKILLEYFGKANSRVLEYWVDNSLFSRWKKPPKELNVGILELRNDLLYYSALGFESVSSFACYLGEDYEALYGEPHLEEFFEEFKIY